MRDGKVVINSSDDAMVAYSKTVQQTNRTTALATAGTKALSAAMKVLSSIGWMIVITLIVEGIKILVNVVDDAITTTEEYREKLSDLKDEFSEIKSEIESVNSELQTTASRLAELRSKNKLTFTEKKEYDNLVAQNNELQRKLDLLKLEEKQKNKEINKTFVKTMSKDLNNDNEYARNLSTDAILEGSFTKWQEYARVGRNPNDTYYSATEKDYISYQFEYRKKLLDQKYNAETLESKDRIQDEIDTLEKYLFDKQTELLKDAEGVSYISNPTTEDDKAVNEWLDYIADFQDKIAIEMNETNAEQNAFNRLVDNWQFDKTVQGLQDLGKESKVTAEMLDDPKYEEFISKLVELGIIDGADNLEDIALAFNKIAESSREAENSVSSAVEYLSNIQSLSKGLDQLGKIYLDIKDKGSFDFSSILNNDDFAEQFNVEGLTKEYNAFIETVTKNPKDIKACQSAFDDLATAYINISGSLESVTEKTKTGTVAMLKQLGVSNAEKLVNEQLRINSAKLADAQEDLRKIKQKGIDTSLNLKNATFDEIMALIEEAKQIGLNTDDLYYYALQKLQANEISLVDSISDDITGLADLCKSLGVASEALKTYYKAKSKMEEASANYYNLDKRYESGEIGFSEYSTYKNDYKKAYDEAFEEAKNATNKAKELASDAIFNKYIDVEYNYKDTKGSSSSKSTAETFDWIETKIERLQRKVENFKEKASNPFESWEIREKYITKQIKKLNKLSETQEKASDKYLKKANNINLSESYKKKVRNGTIDIESIKNEKIKNKIEKYQEWYNKYLESLDAEKDIQNQLQESYKEQFDLISAKYEAEVTLIKNDITDLENAIELAEAKGKEITSSYYNNLISTEKKHISELEKEYIELNNKLKSYKGSKNSEEYKDLVNEIDQVKQAWDEAKISLEDYEQAQKEADWAIFDRKQQKIGDTANDNSFILGLIEDEDMYDDNGNITNYGQTANGLHIANIGLYTKQAQEYADEIAKLDREYANDKTNTYYLERRRELVESQQDSINSIEDEKQALIDLAKDGYDSLLESMQKIIDKRKEALNQIKSLYDYEKSIRESTDEISVIQKQLIAYQGDNSEESQSTIQQLQESLKDAEENLQEKQMDRYIQEQEQLYDKLMEDTQTWVDGLFEKEATLLQGIIDGASQNTTAIMSLIQQVASAAGYEVSTDQLTSLQGYASGSKNIPYNQMNWVHSDELIYRASDGGLLMPLGSGDKVFTKEMSDRLWDMAQVGLKPVLPSMPNITPVQSGGDVHIDIGGIQMYGVNDPVEFEKQLVNTLCNSSRAEKVIWDINFNKNSLAKHRWKN